MTLIEKIIFTWGSVDNYVKKTNNVLDIKEVKRRAKRIVSKTIKINCGSKEWLLIQTYYFLKKNNIQLDIYDVKKFDL